MEVSVIRIGNSKGVRFSKTMLQKYNIKDAVDISLEEGKMVIRPLNKSRNGWDKVFKAMHDNGDDALLIPDVFEDEQLDEWK